MMNDYKIEICANSVESCVEAQRGGAYRVELCSSIPEGGTTPSYGEIKLARKLLNIKLNVIIRPRGGDFHYSEMETEAMLNDIEVCKTLGVDGVVFGCLTVDGDIDIEKNQKLLQASKGMSTTFHRAFDRCRDPYDALEKIISLGFDRILTSGLQEKAIDGTTLISQLVEKAKDRIIIMPGSGINEDNINSIAQKTGSNEFHLSARIDKNSEMKYRNTNFSMGSSALLIEEYKKALTSSERVAETIKKLSL